MSRELERRLNAMFWDIPHEERHEKILHILKNPEIALREENLALRALNSLTWYDLMGLLGEKHLHELLTDQLLSKLFPPGRKIYYNNARRLLSKYLISSSG